MSTAFAITKLQVKILRNGPWFVVIMFVMPLLVMPMLKQTMGLSLNDSGFASASGAEQVVPGMVVLFGFFVSGSVGFSIFREHGWKTWDRIRASAASPRAMLAGVGAPWIAIHVAYQLTLLTVGGLALGLRFDDGSPVAALLVIFGYACAVVTFMLAAAATVRNVNQMAAVQNVGAMVFGALGGALVPVEQLPGWARAVAPVSPAYWAMEGHRRVFLEQAGVVDILAPVGVLLGTALLFAVLGVLRFRIDETKEVFA